MNEQTPPRPTSSVTGVARGGLGTGANLDETQVLLTKDLQAAARSVERPNGRPEGRDFERADDRPVAPAQHVEVAPAHVQPASVEPAAVQPAAVQTAPLQPVPVQAAPPTARTRPVAARRPTARRGRGLAGLLAATFLVLAGVAFVVSRNDGTISAGGSVPNATAPATADPVATDAPIDGNGNGKGGGKGNGNGNGNGNGGGKPK